jgi:hypothetical protein
MLQTKDPERTFTCLIEHVAAVRDTHRALYNGHVVIIVERNLGFEAEHLYRYCRLIPNSSFLRECNSTRIGILTTQVFKMAYVTFLNVLLREERVLCVSDATFVDSLGQKTRVALHDQLAFFGVSFSAVENQFSKQRMAIGGKTGGGKDDLAMAMLFGLYFALDQRYTTVA